MIGVYPHRALGRAAALAVVGQAGRHEQRAEVGVADAELAVLAGGVADRLGREVGEADRDVHRRDDELDDGLEGRGVEGVVLAEELQQVERGEVARGVVERHVLRARVGRGDPAGLGVGVPVVDRVVVLDAGVGALPRGLGDLAHELAGVDGLDDLAGLAGAQAELLAVPSADFQLHRLPSDLSAEAALLLTDNLATGWAAAQRADIPPGGTVVVLGLGAVGLCAVRCAIAQGAGQVFAVDPVEGRREMAARSGATAITPEQIGAVHEATGGRGAAAVIDAVGNDTTMNAALTTVRAGGTVSVVGVHDLNPFPFPATLSLIRSITLRMTTAPVQQTWPALIPLLRSGRLGVDGIFTHAMSLDDAPKAYAAVAARTADCIKVTLTP